MQHLYGVSFRGKMLYFSGSISDDRVKEVEEIANQIDYTLEEDAFCRQLENAIRSKLGIEFNHQPVEHIFRVISAAKRFIYPHTFTVLKGPTFAKC